MTKKEEFLAEFNDYTDEETGVTVCVEVTVPNCTHNEFIINPIENFAVKKEYYSKAYNDDLELITCPSIKIVDYAFRYSWY